MENGNISEKESFSIENVKGNLDEKLLRQNFTRTSGKENCQLVRAKKIAQDFVDLENGIAILSDLKNAMSYIYSGALAQYLGIFQNNTTQEIKSIWEEELFAKLNQDDVLQKYMLELQFFHFIQSIPAKNRHDYYTVNRLRIDGEDKKLLHKMFYFTNSDDQSVELALCLYGFDFLEASSMQGMIINTSDGSVILQTEKSNKTFLTDREKQILRMIQQGRISKEIADALFISVNTVNRHRQNILSKMRVGNAAEACAWALKMGWI